MLFNRIENQNVIHSLPSLDFNRLVTKTPVTQNLKFKRQLWVNIRSDVLKRDVPRDPEFLHFPKFIYFFENSALFMELGEVLALEISSSDNSIFDSTLFKTL